MNKVEMIGNLAGDVMHQYTQSGKAVCQFRLAVQRRFTNAQGVREADFFPVVAWDKTADLAAQYLHKGDRCAVVGHLQTRSYTDKEGAKRYVTEIVAEEIDFLNAKRETQDNPSGPPVPPLAQGAGGFTQVDDSELPF
jgi:single-strand DNA-binding protein